jgi:hypothetical protein
MTGLSSVSDNISELLLLIIKFTAHRQRLHLKNLKHTDNHHYRPLDLPVEEFSTLIHTAISEHTLHQRLVLYDTDTIQFHPGGDLHIHPVEDPLALHLHRKDRKAYIAYIHGKLHENSLNQQIAFQLFKDKEHKVFWIQEETARHPNSQIKCNLR